jgi:hypothetical protein
MSFWFIPVCPEPEDSFNLSAYLRVFKVWSEEEEPGQMHAIITILAFSPPEKESLRTIVSLEPLKGTWAPVPLEVSKDLTHSLSARRLLLISAPS